MVFDYPATHTHHINVIAKCRYCRAEIAAGVSFVCNVPTVKPVLRNIGFIFFALNAKKTLGIVGDSIQIRGANASVSRQKNGVIP